MPVRHSTLYKRFPTCQCVDFELKTCLKTQAKQELFYLLVQVDNLKLRELASCSRSHTAYIRQIWGESGTKLFCSKSGNLSGSPLAIEQRRL